MSRMGETIKSARERAGMTPKALARKCGVSESFVKEVESGRRIASDDQAKRLLKALGTTNPVSTELDAATEAPQAPRPRPKPYVLPSEPAAASAQKGHPAPPSDAWLDALSGVVKRVPIVDEGDVVIDHRLIPVIGGRIEGGPPDKALFFRVPDDALRGFRIHAGDLLLTVPASVPIDGALMLIRRDGRRMVRKVNKLDGGQLMLQSYDREFEGEAVALKNVLIMGHCVRLERQL